jgi:hypothetical protein
MGLKDYRLWGMGQPDSNVRSPAGGLGALAVHADGRRPRAVHARVLVPGAESRTHTRTRAQDTHENAQTHVSRDMFNPTDPTTTCRQTDDPKH